MRSAVGNTSSGPWHVEYELDEDHERNGVICICNPETECDQTVIATLAKFDVSDDEQKANAYLMAAAPEMLGVLKLLTTAKRPEEYGAAQDWAKEILKKLEAE